MEGFMKNHYINTEGIVLKRGGGAWTVCRFNGGLGEVVGVEGVILRREGVDTPLQTTDLTLTY